MRIISIRYTRVVKLLIALILSVAFTSTFYDPYRLIRYHEWVTRDMAKRCDNPKPVYVHKVPKGLKRSCGKVGPELLQAPRTRHGIPYIIHQTYKDEYAPNDTVALMLTCHKQNPDFIYLLWTDSDIIWFLKSHYPEYYKLYKSYKYPTERADVFRLIALYHFGGVYMDVDVECRKPLSKHIDLFQSSCIFDREMETQTYCLYKEPISVMNSVIMSRPQHPFIKYLIDALPQNKKSDDLLKRTGPLFITKMYHSYQLKNTNEQDAIVVAPSKAFSPLADPDAADRIQNCCHWTRYHEMRIFQKALCDNWNLYTESWCDPMHSKETSKNRVTANSILIHRFYHTRDADGKFVHSPHVPIHTCTVLPSLKRIIQGLKYS